MKKKTLLFQLLVLVTAMIDLLLNGDTINNPAADCNQNGEVRINDVTALIDFLLSGTWN